MRLGDLEHLETVFTNLVKSNTGKWSVGGYRDALERIKKAPTVDAVPVVRCADCIHQKTIDNKYACCKFMGTGVRIITNPRNYCSAGRRKEAQPGGG